MSGYGYGVALLIAGSLCITYATDLDYWQGVALVVGIGLIAWSVLLMVEVP